jgi:hypothetical protein
LGKLETGKKRKNSMIFNCLYYGRKRVSASSAGHETCVNAGIPAIHVF